jgi:hypothetical protein
MTASGQTGIFTDQHQGKQTTMHVDTSSVLDIRGTLNVASGTLVMATGQIKAAALAGNLKNGYLALGPWLMAARQLASAETLATGVAPFITASAGDAPPLALTSSGDQSFYLNYASAVVAGIKLPPIAAPVDLSTADGMTFELYGESIGTGTASDAAAAFDIRVWSGIADTEMGSSHPNFTSTPSWQGITVASGDIVGGAPFNITLVPLAHAGRAIRLYDMRGRYVRSS